MSLGTKEYYRSIGYDGQASINAEIIRPRDPGQAAEMEVDLTKITTDDVVCWFHRDEYTFEPLGHKHVRYQLNDQFRSGHPEGFQFSRVQYNEYGQVYEHTRQYLCLFCQRPSFFDLAGPGGLLFHTEHMHPHEIPDFVQNLMNILHLSSRRLAHSSGQVIVTEDLYRTGNFWPHLEYLTDGRSNQLMISPRPSVSQMIVKMSDVNEKLVRHWYYRDIEDFQKYDHRNVVYSQPVAFNCKIPEYSQIKRALLDEHGHTIPIKQQFLCIHCQEPRFFYGRPLITHLAKVHWPIEFPSLRTVQDIAFSKSLRSLLEGI